MSKKHPNRLSVTVTVGEPNRGRWPDPRNMYDARKFRIPSNIEQFVVERNDKFEIVIKNSLTDVEFEGSNCVWREGDGAPISGRVVFSYIFKGLNFVFNGANFVNNMNSLANGAEK